MSEIAEIVPDHVAIPDISLSQEIRCERYKYGSENGEADCCLNPAEYRVVWACGHPRLYCKACIEEMQAGIEFGGAIQCYIGKKHDADPMMSIYPWG